MPPPEVVFALQNPGACNFGTTLVSPIHVAMPSVRLIAHLLLDNPVASAGSVDGMASESCKLSAFTLMTFELTSTTYRPVSESTSCTTPCWPLSSDRSKSRAGLSSQSPAPTKTGTTEEDGVEQISDSCDDEYEFIPTQTSFKMEAEANLKIAHWTARALVTVAIGHSEELVLSH